MTTSKSVLLVDDDEDDQQFFLEALNKIDNATLYSVAQNGLEAIERLQTSLNLPSIIFMDIDMPAMDGIACLAEIVKNPRTKDIPVIMLSASTNKFDEAMHLGARAFLKKPSDGKFLREHIMEMINTDFHVASSMNYLNNIRPCC